MQIVAALQIMIGIRSRVADGLTEHVLADIRNERRDVDQRTLARRETGEQKDALRPARGLVNGLMISVVLWAAILWAVFAMI